MIPLSDKLAVIKEIYSKSRYLSVLVIVSVFIYILNATIVQWSNLKLAGTIGLFNLITTGFYYSVTRETFYTSLMVSLLTGILISILSYKSKDILKKKGNYLGFIPSIAVFLGFLAPGCAACGIGLAAVLGLGAVLINMPFKGLEISLLAIILLIYSINKTLVSFIVCKTPIKHVKSKTKNKTEK